MSGQKPLQYYTCADLDPSTDLSLPKRREGIILAASIAILVFVNLKIFLANRRKCFNPTRVEPDGKFLYWLKLIYTRHSGLHFWQWTVSMQK